MMWKRGNELIDRGRERVPKKTFLEGETEKIGK